MPSQDPFIFIELGFSKAFDFLLGSHGYSYPILSKIYSVVFTIAVPVSLLLLIIIIYSLEKVKRIRHKEEHIYTVKVVPAYDEKAKGDNKLNEKWTKILTHIESANANDWALAIIEADIILGEILEKMGYHGEGIGEMLKSAEKGDFKTLDQAWEAHKIRNAIAHQGSDFAMNQREAKRVIGLYRQVFEEFYYV